MRLRRSLTMVPHQARNDCLVVSAQAGNVGVAYQVFAMLVVCPGVHGQSHVMQQCSELQRHTLPRREFMNRSQLVEELDSETPDMLAVRSLGMHARRKP